jgi:hypothetical protein
MTRHVEQRSRADLAYDGASAHAVKSSIGYWRVATEYADENSFDQELCIRPIRNPFTVYDDPDCLMPDRSDRKKCLVSERVQRDGFKAKYGVEPASFSDIQGMGDDMLEWASDDEVRVGEFWKVITETSTIYQNPLSGKALSAEELAVVPEEVKKQLKSREVETCRVEMHLLTADQVIQSTKWRGRYIPIIAVVGEEEDIEGRKYRKSLIRDAKDAQRAVNYFASAEVEITSLTPKVPFIGPKGAFKDPKWGTMNKKNHPYIEFDGPQMPQRQFPEFHSQGVREAKEAAVESMKAIMGLYDASLGARSNETSGIAIENRAKEGDNATYHFVDNYIRAIRYGGLVIVDLLKWVYDAARVTRILQPDGQAEMQAINTIFVGQSGQLEGVDISQGDYDVVVTAGSYQTQRQENRESMIGLAKVLPQMTQVAPDLIVGQFDFAEAEELKKRLKATVPANILGQDDAQIPPEVQQAMQAVQQREQQLAQIGQQVEQERAAVDADKSKLEAAKTELDASRKILDSRFNELSAKLELLATKLLTPVPQTMPQTPGEPVLRPQ